MHQALKADADFWRQVAERCRAGIRPTAAGALLIDDVIDVTLADQYFSQILIALPKHSGSQSSAREEVREKKNSKDRKREREAPRAEHNPREQLLKKPRAGEQRKFEGPAMPSTLRVLGSLPRNKDGIRMCYGFNLGACTTVQPGATCPKGKHGCMKPKQDGTACDQPHAATSNSC